MVSGLREVFFVYCFSCFVGIDTEELDARKEDLVEEKLEVILTITNTPID